LFCQKTQQKQKANKSKQKQKRKRLSACSHKDNWKPASNSLLFFIFLLRFFSFSCEQTRETKKKKKKNKNQTIKQKTKQTKQNKRKKENNSHSFLFFLFFFLLQRCLFTHGHYQRASLCFFFPLFFSVALCEQARMPKQNKTNKQHKQTNKQKEKVTNRNENKQQQNENKESRMILLKQTNKQKRVQKATLFSLFLSFLFFFAENEIKQTNKQTNRN
jgi:hypothetical protein